MAIRAKLVIIFFGFAIIPMFLLTQVWYSTGKESVTSLLRQRVDDRALRITDQIAQALAGHQARVGELAGRAPLKAYARSLAQQGQALPDTPLRMDLGAFLLAHQKQYAALTCVGRDGRPLFNIESGPGPGGVIRAYFRDQDFRGEDASHYAEAFKATGQQAVSISETEGAAQAQVALVTALRDEAGRAVAALIVKLRVEQLLSEAVGPRVAAGSPSAAPAGELWREPIILNRQGLILYSADPAKQGRAYADALPPAFARAFAALLGGARQDKDIYYLENEEWMVRLRSYPGPPQLSLLVLERYGDAVSGLMTAGLIMLLLTFVLAIVATLLLYYFISGTTASIQRVTRGAKAIAAGNLDHQIKVKTSDETRVLADAFNRMAARLREMIAKESEQRQFESFARLSAVLTHDLKNAILSLSLLVSNMERKFDREGFREDAMRTLSESVDNLQNLVAKLSDPFAQTKGARQVEDLNIIVERALRRTAEQAGERYQITTSLLPGLSAVADAKALERVIENLVINAIEAMPDGGRLHVATRVENEAPVIAVADTGKGMSEEFIRERLFHPFATTKQKGIGLGLYSCRDIIEHHGGRIEVTSRLNVGTEFRIILPALAEAAPAEQEGRRLEARS